MTVVMAAAPSRRYVCNAFFRSFRMRHLACRCLTPMVPSGCRSQTVVVPNETALVLYRRDTYRRGSGRRRRVGTVAIIGDVGGHASQLIGCLKGLGVSSPDHLNEDLTIVQVGYL